ncbi:ZN621 protein, partial [Brachypteracias leptosomus]|nr:ZN621 protein [Brachypteracias leptosomus]
EKLRKCPKCWESFPERSLLLRHRRVHTGEKSLRCHQCRKSFSHQLKLLIHEKVHGGDQLHQGLHLPPLPPSGFFP